MFTGRTDAEAEASILWPPDEKSWLIGKDPDIGKHWRHEEKGATEDKMAGWHSWLDGHGFEQAPGVGDGQGSLAGSSSWGHEESDMTEQLNWTELNQRLLLMVLVPQWPTYMQFVVDYEEYIQKHKERQTILGNNYKLLYILRNTYNDSATYKHVGVF